MRRHRKKGSVYENKNIRNKKHYGSYGCYENVQYAINRIRGEALLKGRDRERISLHIETLCKNLHMKLIFSSISMPLAYATTTTLWLVFCCAGANCQQHSLPRTGTMEFHLISGFAGLFSLIPYCDDSERLPATCNNTSPTSSPPLGIHNGQGCSGKKEEEKRECLLSLKRTLLDCFTML